MVSYSVVSFVYGFKVFWYQILWYQNLWYHVLWYLFLLGSKSFGFKFCGIKIYVIIFCGFKIFGFKFCGFKIFGFSISVPCLLVIALEIVMKLKGLSPDFGNCIVWNTKEIPNSYAECVHKTILVAIPNECPTLHQICVLE